MFGFYLNHSHLLISYVFLLEGTIMQHSISLRINYIISNHTRGKIIDSFIYHIVVHKKVNHWLQMLDKGQKKYKSWFWLPMPIDHIYTKAMQIVIMYADIMYCTCSQLPYPMPCHSHWWAQGMHSLWALVSLLISILIIILREFWWFKPKQLILKIFLTTEQVNNITACSW